MQGSALFVKVGHAALDGSTRGGNAVSGGERDADATDVVSIVAPDVSAGCMVSGVCPR